MRLGDAPARPTTPSQGGGPTDVELYAELEPAPGAARQARQLVTEACARWELPALVGPGCTVVTELVNNAVVHAHTMLRVLVQRRGDGLAVSVTDGSAQLPQPRGPANPAAPGGRGLLVVDALASEWGFVPQPSGKTVWAVVAPTD
jgi:anti-sigma regulatory factor (Ser/Thr protein kinase)